MWNKLIEYAFKFLIMPLATKLLDLIWKFFKDSKEDNVRNEKIDDATNKIKEAAADEGRKKALKDLVRGVGSLHP